MRESIIGRRVGASVKRVEDRRLLAGAGRYIDDVTVPGMLHAAFLRSPLPHAELTSVDVTAARVAPGVVAVYTGEDLRKVTNPLSGLMAMEGLYDPCAWALAVDRVRVVGDPVAMVVATSRAVAEDACEAIEVDYEPLDAVANVEAGLDPGSTPLWPRARGNVLYRASDDYGDVDAGFAAADRVVRATFCQHRLSNQPMETRGIVAEVVPGRRGLRVHACHQAAHVLRWGLAYALAAQPTWRSVAALARRRDHTRRIVSAVRALLAGNPSLARESRAMTPIMAKQAARDPSRFRFLIRGMLGVMAADASDLVEVVTGDIGGAFGSKTSVLREEVAVCAAARELGRSVKWIEDRNENLMVGGQARDEQIDVDAAVCEDGRLLALKVSLTMDSGAYPSFPYGAPLFARMIEIMLPGPYDVPAMRFDTALVATNKATYVPYRGPWAAETWVRERLWDVIARELGLSRAEVRLRNIVGPDRLPMPMLTGPTLDVRMSARTTLVRALELVDLDGWEATKAAALAEGRRVGVGFATYIEAAPGPPGYMEHVSPGFGAFLAEPSHMVLEQDGTVTVHTQQVPHGQGIETTLIQIVTDELGVEPDGVRVVWGDTNKAPFGVAGTGGSRSAAMAGGAVSLAARDLRRRIADLAAELLEAAPDDVVIADGRVHVAGVPSRDLGLDRIADEARTRGPAVRGDAGLDEAIRVSSRWDGGEGGWSQSTHVCWVEVDLDTGQVAIPRYAVVEDCGEIINPAIVDGQIRGGVAQGIGAVLYEKVAYSDDAQLQSGTFMDYLVPTSAEIPAIEVHHVETPSDIAFNYRGVGEGGMIGAPAAVTNAIEDALADLGVEVREQHLPPTRILELAGVIPAK